MLISIIAAISDNNVIGYQNKIPWHLPADFIYFKKITLGKPVIMGAKTYLSIGKPLPGRKNIILNREPGFQAPGCIVVSSLEEALKAAEGREEVMICGGASVYEQFLARANKLYLTFVHHEFPGDTFFPHFNKEEWQEIKREDHKADSTNPYPYSFVILKRKPLP